MPQRRFLAYLVLGAALVLLTTLTPLIWVVAGAYHAALLLAVVRDARRLPPASRFRASRQLPTPFSLGAEQSVLVGVACAEAAGLRASLADHAPSALVPVPREVGGVFDAEGVFVAEYTTRPPRRGEYTFPAIDLRVWRDGGWWLRQFRLPVIDRAAVYPDVLAVRRYQLTLRRGLRLLPGQRRARPPGAATAVAGLREYLPGDEARRINWKATARRDRPVVNELEAERGQPVMILIDCGRLMTAPAGHLTKLDHAVNAALLLAWVAQAHGDRIGLMTFSDSVHQFLAPRRGPQQAHQINEALYRLEASYTEPEFGEAFGYLARQAKGRSLVVVLTDVLDPEASADLVAHILKLASRHLVLTVAMADPELLNALRQPVTTSLRAYEWAAGEELMGQRRRAFETLQRGGVLSLDVEAGRLSAALVERYLELKERALL